MGDKHDERLTGLHDDNAQLACIVGDVQSFRTSVWGRRPMRRTASPGFEHFLSTEMIEEWLAHEARRPNFRVVKVGDTFHEREYTRTVRMGGTDVEGVADLDAIAALIANGATLVLQNLEFAFPAIRRLLDDLARGISHPVQVNAYLTPPAATGLGRHADAHDVLILQVEGSKSWEVDGLGSFDVGPGDVIYIPRGTPHVARTTGHTSLHITVGLLRVTMRHVLRRMLDQLDPDLDEALPLNFADLTVDELADVLRPRIGQAVSMLASSDLRNVAEAERTRVSHRIARQRRRALSTALTALTLTPDSILHRVVDGRLEPRGDRVVLHVGERTISFPAVAQGALQMLCSSDSLTVAQLAGIDESSQLVVARRLLREGVVSLAPRCQPTIG